MATNSITEAERIKSLAEFKTGLEQKISATEKELESLRTLLNAVDDVLLEKGFKRAEAKRQKPSGEAQRPLALKQEAPTFLKTATGEILASMHVDQRTMQVTIPKDKIFDVKTPPFQQFLIERVLDKMREKDTDIAKNGHMPLNRAFSYNLTLEGDVLREIRMDNLTQDRIRELKSSIHWTLEKMHEKTKGQTSA